MPVRERGDRQINNLRSFLQVLFGTNALNDRVRQTLVASLYTHPSSLALGAACGVGTSVVAASLAKDPWIVAATVTLFLIASFRVGAAFYLQRRTERHGTRQLELVYESGAWSYALVLGVIAALAVGNRVEPQVELLAETNARLAEKMQMLARTDVVTGLFNRAGLNHHLVERLMRLCGERKLALFWLDLDRFKEVNDTLGHPVGDRVLSEIATRLRKRSPPDATIARFGGDEFIIACETEGRAELETLAAELLKEITRPIRIDGDRLEIRSSMGIAMMPDDGSDLDSLMQGADLALYHSKVKGRNQFSFFDPSMTRDLVRRREIESELRQALQKEELSIFYQPIVDLATGQIRSFEALVRWFHPEKGELRPDEFIPVAEETGVIITLGNWITAQAAKAAAQWPDDVTICVNLSDKYPFSKIKVDRSFVSGINVGKTSDAIIRAVAEMANTLEMEIVAEGLETVDQVRAVRAAGCTLGQGYYFSRAVPDHLAALLLVQEQEGARRLTA
ncbi:MAG: EAL domain-containing protein [Novosphingobium sp.]|nr:EAL domain-containing protein [Novosphingobium sp.]